MEVILDGAARILEREGLERFNTNAVAAVAGVSVGSLYQYFPGKDALMAALVRRDAGRFSAEVAAAVVERPGEDWRAAVSRLIAVAVGHQLDFPNLARILDFEEARLPLDDETEAAERSILSAIVGVLRRGGGALAHLDLSQAAADLLRLTRALVDAEGRERAPDRESLSRRLERAVFGYLTWDAGAESACPNLNAT
ncbi:TetR/AcrR family transcriptional regulator [uncultured Caulobacter sp.]|uniref:TetR/AcrR family transcriptional regulator n=1 Tax=uncultured Caulobacter sp. TaxID=158749 RepID=UPI002625BC42|nr:TetR family transcriptional regulator [uncultured Caulobacter sp.]